MIYAEITKEFQRYCDEFFNGSPTDIKLNKTIFKDKVKDLLAKSWDDGYDMAKKDSKPTPNATDIQRYKSIDEFEQHLGDALKLAENGKLIEVWQGGDYYSISYKSLQAKSKA